MRTSYFPGLGWMLRRELWNELTRDFPQQAWDHWMRLNATARGMHSPIMWATMQLAAQKQAPLLTAGRECVVPEVSRNRNFGMEGVNMEADTFHRYFSRMAVVQVCKVLLIWLFHALASSQWLSWLSSGARGRFWGS